MTAVAISQATGTQARSAMVVFDGEENATFATGSTAGVTVAVTDAAGFSISSAAVLYTAAADMTLHEGISELAKLLNEETVQSLAGATAYSQDSKDDLTVLNVLPVGEGRASQGGAYNVALTLPVFTQA